MIITIMVPSSGTKTYNWKAEYKINIKFEKLTKRIKSKKLLWLNY